MPCLKGYSSDVTSVCALEGARLASGSGDKTIRVWNMSQLGGAATTRGAGEGVVAARAHQAEAADRDRAQTLMSDHL